MLTFKNLEEMKPYYNKNTNIYEFMENEEPLDVCFDFDLAVKYSIKAGNITAWDIDAWDIKARNIKAGNINFYAICFAYETFKCKTIHGHRENSKYFCLDNEIAYKK